MIEITLTWLDGKRKGAVESFTQLPLRLGRADECEVRFDAEDLKVSAKHAEVRSNGDGGLEVEDLGSKNGTLVNGAATQGATPLQNHAIVQLGKDGPRVKVAFVVGGDSPSGVSFSKMRKQKTEKLAGPKHLTTTDQTPTYSEADLGPPRQTRQTLVLAVVLGLVAVGAVLFFVLR